VLPRRGCVVALGGGSLERAGNADRVRAAGVVVWLRVTPRTAARRCATSGESRPLVPGARDREEEASLLLRRREPTWRAACNAEVDAEGPLERVVAAALRVWKGSQSGPG